jgi:hypothetical protein
MTKVKQTSKTKTKFIQSIVKSQLFEEKDWPANPEVTRSMTTVFEEMGLLKTDDDGLIVATPMGKKYNIEFLLNIAGLQINDRMEIETGGFSNITHLDEAILLKSIGTSSFLHFLRNIAMRIYYEHYDIALGSDEDPLNFRELLDLGHIEVDSCSSPN